MNTQTAIIGIVVVGLIAIGAIWWFARSDGPGGQSATTTPTTTPTSTPTTTPSGGGATTTSATSSVRLAFLDTRGATNGKERGCDKVVMVPWRVATTTAPLTAAMRALFGISTTSIGSWYNFIDRTNETLKFDRATVVSGTANIYLTGSLSGLTGVCDDPRAQIQIEETALQFPTVQRVQIFLNNASTTLTPSQQ